MIQKRSMAMLRRRLENNKPVLVVGDYIEAAVLIAVTAQEGSVSDVSGFIPELILTRRASHLSIHPGEAAFPGGKKDHDDKSLLATALREAAEEVSLLPASVEYLGALDQRVTRTGIRVSPYVGVVSADTVLTPNLDELDCIYRVPLSFFKNSSHLVWVEMEYMGGLRQVPHFYFQEHCIMGVTALMIIDLMKTVFDIDLHV